MNNQMTSTAQFTIDELFAMNECTNGTPIRNEDGYLKKFLPDDWSDFKHDILINGLRDPIKIELKDSLYTISDGVHRIIALKELQNEGLYDKDIKLTVSVTVYKITNKLKFKDN